MATRDCVSFLETAIEDIVSACVRFESVAIVACALQINNVKIETDHGCCADQLDNINIWSVSIIDIEYIGNLDWLKKLHWLGSLRSIGYVQSIDVCRRAVYSGHLDMLQWARANNYPWNSSTSRMAASNGRLEVLQWMIENGCPYDTTDIAKIAHARGHQDIVHWILHTKYPVPEDTPIHITSKEV